MAGGTMSPDFVQGLIVGFLAAGLLGFLLGRVRFYRKAMGAADRPQAVTTKKTPRQVMSASSRAGCFWVIWLVLLLVVVAGSAYLLFEYVL
jgi:hypothetical protein